MEVIPLWPFTPKLIKYEHHNRLFFETLLLKIFWIKL